MFKELFKRRVAQIADSKYSKIKVLPGSCRYNFRCHNNAVHDAIERGDEYIAMVIYFDDKEPVIHFINVDKKGVYVDNTLGHWSQTLDYYLVRTIPRESFFDVYNIFAAFRLEIHRQLPLYVRLFVSKNEI